MGLLQTIVADGNHYDPEFLYDCELERLEVNEAGATRNMFEPISEDELQNSKESFLDPQKYISIDDTCYRVDQARMLLMNIVFIRLLINHVVLTPWHCSVCSRPPGKYTRNVIKNLRIVASLLYLSARSLDSQLPTIQVQEVIVRDEKAEREKAEKDKAEAAIAALTAGNEVGIDVKEENDEEGKTKKEKRDLIKETISWLVNTFSFGEANGTDINEDHCQRVLLGEKDIRFDSMQDFQNFLLPLEYFVSTDSNKALFESICKELRSRLNRWLTKLSVAILHYRIQLHEAAMDAQEEVVSRPATVMSAVKSSRRSTPGKDGGRIQSASPVRTARGGTTGSKPRSTGDAGIKIKSSAR